MENDVKPETNLSNQSAFEEGNPDFDASKDCAAARGACYLQDVMANETPKEEK